MAVAWAAAAKAKKATAAATAAAKELADEKKKCVKNSGQSQMELDGSEQSKTGFGPQNRFWSAQNRFWAARNRF